MRTNEKDMYSEYSHLSPAGGSGRAIYRLNKKYNCRETEGGPTSIAETR